MNIDKKFQELHKGLLIGLEFDEMTNEQLAEVLLKIWAEMNVASSQAMLLNVIIHRLNPKLRDEEIEE